MSSLFWSGKTPRISKKHLIKSRSEGGLSLPQFKSSYLAAYLNILLFWFGFLPGNNLEEMPTWLQIEHLSCQCTSLPALIISPVNIKKHLYIVNPIIYNSLKIWKQVYQHSQRGLQSSIPGEIPLYCRSDKDSLSKIENCFPVMSLLPQTLPGVTQT